MAADNALWALCERIAPAFETTPDDLEAAGGELRSKSDPGNRMAWREACELLGNEGVSVRGQHDRSLSSSGTAGVCAADVEVDTETGGVRALRIVAVQEAGLVIDRLTAESQVIGGVIQGLSWALFEDRIMDRLLGHQINPDFEGYKIAGAMDMPEIEPVMWMKPESLARGVIGIGEPPVIAVAGAIGNAVKNAIGVRVADLPITPARVLSALAGGGGKA